MKRLFVLILAGFLLAATFSLNVTAYADEHYSIEILQEKRILSNDRMKVSAEFLLPAKFDSLNVELSIVKFDKTLNTDTLNIKLEDENSLLLLSFSYSVRDFAWYYERGLPYILGPILVVAVKYNNEEKGFYDIGKTTDLHIEIKKTDGQYEAFINEIEFVIQESANINFNVLTFESIWGKNAYLAPLVIEITKITLLCQKEREENDGGGVKNDTEDKSKNNSEQGDDKSQDDKKSIKDNYTGAAQRPLLLDIAVILLGASLIVFAVVKITKKIKAKKDA